MDIQALTAKARHIRRMAFDMVMRAGCGHLGGSLSCTELLVALYYGGLLRHDPHRPDWPDRDRCILSKGHANNTLYAVLADRGYFPVDELGRYGRAGCALGNHCDRNVPGVEIISGSLGHGLGIAAGLALAARLDGLDRLTFCLIGDGESQEGSIWEAAMFGAQHRLSGLVALVDRNGLGSEDFTERTAGLEPLPDKWRAFGWETRVVDGHDLGQILDALADCRQRRGAPLALIAQTVKGKGLSVLENTPRSHHTLPCGDEVAVCREELS